MSSFTKNAIKEAFLQLLDEKPLSQITVKQIVEACGVNRNTFYYHYQDVPALIEEIMLEQADRIIAEYPTVDSIQTAMLVTVEFASGHKRAILHIYNSTNRDIFELYLWKVCEYVVTTYSRTLFGPAATDDFDRQVVEQLYKCTCFGLVIDYLNKRMKQDVVQQIDRLCQLCQGMTEELVRRSRET